MYLFLPEFFSPDQDLYPYFLSSVPAADFLPAPSLRRLVVRRLRHQGGAELGWMRAGRFGDRLSPNVPQCPGGL